VARRPECLAFQSRSSGHANHFFHLGFHAAVPGGTIEMPRRGSEMRIPPRVHGADARSENLFAPGFRPLRDDDHKIHIEAEKAGLEQVETNLPPLPDGVRAAEESASRQHPRIVQDMTDGAASKRSAS